MRTLSIRSLLRSSVLPLGLALGLSACGPEQASANNPLCFADPSETQSVVCFTEPWDIAQPWDVVQTTVIQADSVEAQLVIRDGQLVIRDNQSVAQGGTPWDVAPAVIIRDNDRKHVSLGKPWDRTTQTDGVSAMGKPWDRTAPSEDVKPAVIIRGAPADLVIRDLTASHPSLQLACGELAQGLTFCRAE